MKRVVNFSGGLGSFWAAMRVKEEFGTNDLTLLFADVLIEDASLYEFNRRAQDIIGVPITRISEELAPWQLFRREGMIGNARFPICSIKLKREPLERWHRENCMEMDTVIYLGFDFSEHNRLEKVRANEPGWRFEAPLCNPPLWDKCRMISEAVKIGLPEQPAYTLGFPHNNCGLRCVSAGISHWVHLYHVLPERYLEWEAEEIATQEDMRARGISNWQFTILKDRRGGENNPLTLRALRLRIESGEVFPKYDWGGCGCST